jgi:hypothetical protein
VCVCACCVAHSPSIFGVWIKWTKFCHLAIVIVVISAASAVVHFRRCYCFGFWLYFREMKMRRRRRRSSIYTHSKRSFEHKLNVGRLTTDGREEWRERERWRKGKSTKRGGWKFSRSPSTSSSPFTILINSTDSVQNSLNNERSERPFRF